MNDLLRCCGSRRWAEAMFALEPFSDEAAMLRAAEDVWRGLTKEDWLEAFGAHPKIGERKRLTAWSKQEQAAAASGDEGSATELERLNRDYEQRFGYIFIICATGKSADQILDSLRRRLMSSPEEEIFTAANEQLQITGLRLKKLLAEVQ